MELGGEESDAKEGVGGLETAPLEGGASVGPFLGGLTTKDSGGKEPLECGLELRYDPGCVP